MLRNVSREALGRRPLDIRKMWKRMISPIHRDSTPSSNDTLFYSVPGPVMFIKRQEAVTECIQQKRKDIRSNRVRANGQNSEKTGRVRT